MTLNLYRYNVEDTPFAQGGMGDVYRAVDLLSQEIVVIKTINALRLHLDEKTIRTFFKEAEASFRLGQLSNHIIKVTDIGFESGTHFMVQEYATGGNLIPRLGKVDGKEARLVIDDILKGLKVAHENKIIHSDISPDNILFDAQKSVYKLSDFGLLKIMESHLITRGVSLHRGGKPYYMPPAHYFDPDKINQKTDFYAIGVVYHQLLTGEILKPLFPDPPTVPQPVVIKAEGANLMEGAVRFIESCLHQKFEDVDDLIQAFSKLSAWGDTRTSAPKPRKINLPKFEVSMMGTNVFRFTLISEEGQPIFSGDTYRSRAHAKAVIKTIRQNAVVRERYSRRQIDNKHYFTLNTAKKEPLGHSVSFASNAEMEEKIDWMIANAPTAVVSYAAKTLLMK